MLVIRDDMWDENEIAAIGMSSDVEYGHFVRVMPRGTSEWVNYKCETETEARKACSRLQSWWLAFKEQR